MPRKFIPLPHTSLRKGHTLMLRTCVRDSEGRLTAHGGFIWPAHGPVECPDWKPTKACGNGLHGFLRGCGSGRLADWTDKAVWLVVDIVARQLVDLGDKIKVPGGRVIFSGDRLEALALMARLGHLDAGHVGGTATAGDRGTATAGYRGTATAGDSGTATAGDSGTATAGDGGTATAGDRGTATAGDCGTIQIKWWDDKAGRYRITTGYVGEDGIEANTKYHLVDTKFVRVEPAAS